MSSEQIKNGHVPSDGNAASGQNGHVEQSPQSAVAHGSVKQPVEGVRTPSGAMRLLRPLLSLRSRPVTLLENEPHTGTVKYLVLSSILLSLILSVVMSIPMSAGQVEIAEGVPAAQDIYSPAYLHYESKVRTQKARDDATSDHGNEVWVQDAELVQKQRSILLNNLAVVDSVRSNAALGMALKRQRLSSMQGISLTQQMMDTMLGLSDGDYGYWRDNGVLPGFDAVMRDRRLTSDSDVQAARASLVDRLSPSLGVDDKATAAAFISSVLTVNVHLDEAATQQRREQAAANIKPVMLTVQKGEVVLRQGELATPESLEKMQAAGLLSKGISVQSVAGTAGVVSLLMLLLHLYIFRYAPHVWQRQKQLLLVGMLMVVTMGVARVFLPGHELLPYLLPLASISMLLAVLLSPNLAVLVTFVMSILVGMVVGSSLSMELPIYYFVGGLTGIFTLTRIERVSTFARAGFSIAIVSFLTALALKLLMGSILDWPLVGMLALAAAFNAGISTSITYAAFSLLGTLFGITTPLQLMELAHPDQPLLRRLMREAPGTYHHSLVVSNLAERAAETIGGDALLTRVCAYYHDIGKVERPYYFIDNQSGMSNVHDQMDPRASATIIAEHVSDGIKLGQKYKLPRRVLDAIPQHHGTMLIKFFYHKAMQDDPTVSADDFRYPGPKPQTKENAILMLADGVEATVRAMAQSGALDKMASTRNNEAKGSVGLYDDTSSLPEDAIAKVVHQIISERIEDGQLDECDLTVRDIARIQEAFVSMLKGIYHPRVAYPEAPKNAGDHPGHAVAANSAVAVQQAQLAGDAGRQV